MKNLLTLLNFVLFSIILFQPATAQEEPLKLVKSFIKDLDRQDFKSAYEKVNISAWGDYNQFSSDKAFGSIISAKLFEIREENDITGLTGIFVDAEYLDPVNGNARYKEKFYVEKKNNQLKIVKLKLIKKEKLPETRLHPSDSDCQKFFSETNQGLEKGKGDFTFINYSFTGLHESECFVMHKIVPEVSGTSCMETDEVGFLCFRDKAGKWTLSSISGLYGDLEFFDFDNDSIAEICDNESCPYMVGEKVSYSIYSWKNEKQKQLYHYENSFVPLYQMNEGSSLSKGDCVYDNTGFKIEDVDNDGLLELIQNIEISTISKNIEFPGLMGDKEIKKFENDYVQIEKRTIIYTYQNGKFIVK